MADELQRPAEALDKLSGQAQTCFAGLFNGAINGNISSNGSLFVGKAECEWHYPAAWDELVAAGLVEYTIITKHGAGSVDKIYRGFQWQITELGWSVREDDLALFRQQMDETGD